MQIERGLPGGIPYAATGSGAPVVICAGLWPTTGVGSDTLVRGSLAPLRALSDARRLIVVNRSSGLPVGLTMADLAAQYAQAIGAELGAPVDVLGNSTGGSIAQQLAADHPETVRRLVLLSTGCRLGAETRAAQYGVAVRLRANRIRSAAALAAADLVPVGLRAVARGVGWLGGRRVIPDALAAADLAATLEAEDGFDLARCARPIEAPTLIIGGGRDRYYAAELFRETAALIPNSELRIFPRRGHVSVGTDRRAQAAIAGFLNQE